MHLGVHQIVKQLVYRMTDSLTFNITCSLTDLLPCIIGIKKIKLTHDKHRSFIIYLSIAAFVGINGIILTIFHQYNYARILSNCFVLFDGISFIFLYFLWEVFNKRIILFTIMTFLFAIWIIDNFFINTISNINSLYRVIYSTVTILLAIKLFQQVYFNNINYSLKDPLIIISAMLIINYSYRAVFESLYLFKLDFSNNFYSDAFKIFVILNIVSNCTFTYAISCMDLKKRLTLY